MKNPIIKNKIVIIIDKIYFLLSLLIVFSSALSFIA